MFCICSVYICRKKSGKIKTSYKQEYINLNCDVDFDFAGPTIHGAAVAGYVYFCRSCIFDKILEYSFVTLLFVHAMYVFR